MVQLGDVGLKSGAEQVPLNAPWRIQLSKNRRIYFD